MRTDYLNPQIYNRLYGVMTYENVLALRVALETGLRIDDVLSLKRSDLQGRTLRGLAEKTGKPFRKVISRDLSDRLVRLTDDGYFFPHRIKRGEHRTRQAVWSNMKTAAARLGVQLNAAPHSARKTYAVEVFRDKGIEAAQKELQHDRLSTTMLYCFSDMISQNSTKSHENVDFLHDLDEFAEIIANKVVEKLKKMMQK